MPDIFVQDEEIKDEKKVSNGTPILSREEKKGNLRIFAAYSSDPTGVKFADQLEDEELLLFLRRHFVTNVPWLIKAFLLSLLPIGLLVLQMIGFINLDFIPGRFQAFFIILYFLVVWTYIFVNYITWFYNISLVTSKRIIDIDFSSVVFENVSATKLTQVEDVSYSQVGVIRSIFDYGNVLIQTAGTASEFEFLAVPHPELVIKVVNKLIGEASDA